MSLSFEEFKVASVASSCMIARIMKNLDDQDRQTLAQAIADEDISGSTIARVMKARGVPVSASSVRRHRRGDCACG